jgi:Arc/MetJ-type ribon-helix-helix transcriptional regulator
MSMAIATKKVTVHLPERLLRKAQQSTGKGVTDTIRDGLRLVAAGDAYRKLQRLRGTVKFSVDLGKLREDRA